MITVQEPASGRLRLKEGIHVRTNSMRKALVTVAIGDRYERWEQISGQSRLHYAKQHGWEYIVIRSLPTDLEGLASRPFSKACMMAKLLVPDMTHEYEIVATMDGDTFLNPNAECLTRYEPSIPAGGFAAVNTVTQEERHQLFPSWDVDYYQRLEKECALDKAIERRDLYINGGLLLFRPHEVAERWRELAVIPSKLSQENRLNVYEVQRNVCFALPEHWNTLWLYEKYRLKLLIPTVRRVISPTFIANEIKNRLLWRLWEKPEILRCLARVSMVHLAFEHHKIECFADFFDKSSTRL